MQNRRGQKRLIRKLRLAGSDQAHLVDLVSVAATGQVVDGCVQALQDGAVGSVTAQTLSDLIADVAGLDAYRFSTGISSCCSTKYSTSRPKCHSSSPGFLLSTLGKVY